MDYLAQLNPEQREAVLHVDGPLLILAGAGSGKTRVITSRIAHLIGDGHARPDEVLAVTFTNKAAEEMRTRVEPLLGARLPPTCGCRRSTRSAPGCCAARRPAIGLSRDFVIYDSADQLVGVKQALRELQIDEAFVQPRAALSRISHAKNRMEGPDALGIAPAGTRATSRSRRSTPTTCRRSQRQQRARLRRPAAQDASSCFEDSRRRARDYAAQFRYRDGRRIPGHEPAAVPADPAARRRAPQPLRRRRSRSVHLPVARRRSAQHPRFRGGLPRGDRSCGSSATTARPRSSSTRPRPSSAGTCNRKDKRLWTDGAGGDRITLPARRRRARGGGFHHAHRPDGVARGRRRRRWPCSTAPTRSRASLEDALRREGVAYRIVGSVRFYERKEVKDALAYLKLVAQPDDDVSLRRVVNVPARGIGKGVMDALESVPARQRCAACSPPAAPPASSLWARLERGLGGRTVRGRARPRRCGHFTT